MNAVGKSIPHDSAAAHVRGRAEFIDDIAPRSDELFVGFVGSPVARGTLTEVDLSVARTVPGVHCFLTADDIPGVNNAGPVIHDEPFLPDHELLYLGQPVVVVAATSRAALAAAREAVRVTAEPQEPLLDLDAAIEQESFIGPLRTIRQGDVERALADAQRTLEGTTKVGGQEQFYFESQAAIAYPGEGHEMVVHSSTQNPTEIQSLVAEALGLGQHQVVCICRRMGGAFGGKETQAAIPALMAALVAHKTQRPARVIYDKDDDMRVTGKRHAYSAQWQVGFEPNGRITALRIAFYSDGGAAADLSLPVMERTLLHADNAYYLPNVEFTGRVCRTNKPPNTAFRGFGGPQAVAVVEGIIESIAHDLKLDAYDVRLRNVYGVGERDLTPYGQVVRQNHLPEILATLAVQSEYKQRLAEIRTANGAEFPLQFRGISMTAVKFGISFTNRTLNQGNALVNVYTDGTVQVSTGGTEMGQGLNTKIQQLVADAFGIEVGRVIVRPTSTEKNNNTSATAASASTDINGAAAVRAAEEIKQRLAAFAAQRLASAERGMPPSADSICFRDGQVIDIRQPERAIPFTELTAAAWLERVDMGARGFYATPGIDFNRETGKGNPFFYYTQGAAVVEVALDRFTGELRVPRADLLLDIGESINPGVDEGQVTGGFLQGVGWATMEQLCYADDGSLLSHSPTTYKIPAVTDLPEEFHVSYFANSDNIQNIRRSKAVGEPPLLLGVAAWTAVQQALSFVNPTRRVHLQLPATNEEILRQLTLLQAPADPAPAPGAGPPAI